MSGERDDLLTLAADAAAGLELLCSVDEFEFATLLHGLLSMYSAAARVTCTELGLVALGVCLEQIAESDPDLDKRAAAAMILAHSAVRATDAEGAFCNFGAVCFNDVLTAMDDAGRCGELTIAIAKVWRRLMPHLHTTEGLEILRRVQW